MENQIKEIHQKKDIHSKWAKKRNREKNRN